MISCARPSVAARGHGTILSAANGVGSAGRLSAKCMGGEPLERVGGLRQPGDLTTRVESMSRRVSANLMAQWSNMNAGVPAKIRNEREYDHNHLPPPPRKQDYRVTRNRTFVLLALAFLTFAASARADDLPTMPGLTLTDTPVVDARLDAGLAAAAEYWGRLPNCPPLAFDEADESGALTPASTVGVGIIGGCRLWISTAYLASTYADPASVCRVVVHEVGHLLGHDHTPHTDDDPANVMDETGLPGWPAPCLRMLPPATVHEIHSPGWSLMARNRRRPSDRAWCRTHQPVCLRKYPHLYAASIRP